MGKINSAGTRTSWPVTVVIGAAVSLLTSIGAVALCATLIASEKIGANRGGYCAAIILLLGSFTGSVVIGKGKEKRINFILLIGACYMLMLIAITALFFGGRFQGIGMSSLAVFSGCVLALFLTQNPRNRTKLHGSKNRRR